ncbi:MULTISPECIES: hypothetical protein [unclassified Streptomyces]|uniref:hypothetical protein n=1 Tax=unclassified Streptomyces TaxID=2593676 RepID=UPI0018F88CF1|nr:MULTISPECIES: hypothetical protein [unclassified Streptomyces]
MVIWIGSAGLVVAACCAFLARAAHARARAMERTETLPVQELRALHEAAAAAAGPGHFRYRCEVVGQARPHRDGALPGLAALAGVALLVLGLLH